MKTETRSQRSAWLAVAALAVFAAARVIVYSAAFPLFNNVDEQAHVDLVVKYARGNPPTALANISPDAARLFTLYSSPEYLSKPDAATQLPPPIWRIAADYPRETEQLENQWQQQPNLESGEPPLYYAIAGGWFRLGEMLSIKGGILVYWVRFLNALPAAALVLLAFLFSRRVTGSPFTALSSAALVAVIPQDAFYSVASDGWAALWFGIACWAVASAAEDSSTAKAALAGLAIAASCLTKLAALPFAVVGAIVALAVFGSRSKHRALNLSLLTLAGALPIAGWMMRNRATFGDVTATASKVAALGWVTKPVAQWLPHPLFSVSGAHAWWPELVASFWRGEFVWHWDRIASPGADAFYWISTTLLVLTGVAAPFLARSSVRERFLHTALFACLAAGIAFIVLLSVRYDFGDCIYPSRAKPYFTSGRLLFAGLLPFAALYASGLDLLTRQMPAIARTAIVAAICIFVTANEAAISAPAFGSRYNFVRMLTDHASFR